MNPQTTAAAFFETVAAVRSGQRRKRKNDLILGPDEAEERSGPINCGFRGKANGIPG